MQDAFNGLGQLTAVYQNPGGQVNTSPGGTPSVGYAYAGPSSTQNYSRLTALTYPNSRKLDYVYNGGIDAAVGRVSALADDDGSGNPSPAHLADYSYLGPSTVVTEGQGDGNALTYVKQANDTTNAIQNGDPRFGGDQYTGLDRFGRVVNQNYVSTSTGTPTTAADQHRPLPVRLRPGRATPCSAHNLISPGFSELYHQNGTADGDNNSTATGYDPLDRLTSFTRGTLTSSGHNGPTTLPTATTPSPPPTHSPATPPPGAWTRWATGRTAAPTAPRPPSAPTTAATS